MLKAELWAGILLAAALPWAAALGMRPGAQTRARSLASVMAEEREKVLDIFAAEPEEEVVLMGTSFPSLPTIHYVGSARPTPPERIDVIRRWVRGYGMNPRLVGDFRTEMLFQEDSLNVWLPVHGDLVEAIAAGRPNNMTLFLVWAGARRDRSAIDWVFVVYGYRSDGARDSGPEPAAY